ncbi:MAG TPA: YecA family protein [Rhodanobacteraceae bacterium]|nr:YecA family protein [Rhodanobacteraceae bacterium]
MIDHPAAPDDTELDQLDLYFRDHAADDTLLLDGVHGLLTALAVGPEPALPDEWLAEVLHQPFADEAEGGHILDLLARLNDSIPLELASEDYEPILGEVEQPSDDLTISAAGWLEGFSRGIDLRAPIWESRLAEDQELMEMMGPLMALALDDGIFVSDAEFERLTPQDYEACLNQIPDAVAALAHYWRVRPPSERERKARGGASVSDFHQQPRRRGGRWVH